MLQFTGTILFISHDRYFINKVASRIIEITKEGTISYNGRYEDYLLSKQPAIIKEEVKQTKVQQTIDRKTKNEIKKVERQISALEEKIKEMQTELRSDEVMDDYQRYNDLQSQIEENENELENLYEKWESLQM